MKKYIKPEVIIQKFDCTVVTDQSTVPTYTYSAEVMNKYLFVNAGAVSTTTVKWENAREIMQYNQ